MIDFRVFSPKRARSVTTTMFIRHTSKQKSRRKVEKQFPHKHAVVQPAAVRKESLRQRCLIWRKAACRLAATVPLHSLENIGSSLGREADRANCKINKNQEWSVNEEANRRKGESRASSPFPLGGFSALPHTRGIPQPLEARPYGQTMPAHLRVRHLDLTARRQQALIARISPRVELQPFSSDLFLMASREATLASRESEKDRTTCPWLNLKYASHLESLCLESVIIRPAAACDWTPRQRRLIWVGAAYRLAVAALLPPLTYVASSLGYELDCLVQELDNQGYQAQESIQPVHRQFTSSQGRQRCRLTGLTPLTYRYYSRLDPIIQTYVRYCSRTQSTFEHRLPAPRSLTPYTKMPENAIRQKCGKASSNTSRKVIAVFSKPARTFPVQAHPIYPNPRTRHAAISKTSGLFTQDMQRDCFPLVSLQPTVMNNSRRGICHG